MRARVMRLGHRARRLWWRLRKPTTYGVKALLKHPDDPAKCLVVRHSYVDQQWWALPGGGYDPRKETAEAAAVREVSEELSLEAKHATVLKTLTTELEGKVDHLAIVTATATSADFRLNAELAEARWVSIDLGELPADALISRWLRLAVVGEEGAADGHGEDRDQHDQRRRDEHGEHAGDRREGQTGR
ncbi:NUDIX domain-containing protein [Kribbella sp. NPDC051718]|uniref:NUDIX hydrolase n=1 Tax=Kribbella sp. NPDC051718 TaxID=3155168 RepID=UPI003430FBA1